MGARNNPTTAWSSLNESTGDREPARLFRPNRDSSERAGVGSSEDEASRPRHAIARARKPPKKFAQAQMAITRTRSAASSANTRRTPRT
jgi:hypothetical protein